MTNSERNDLLFCSEFTDVSKWDLHGLNSITGFTDTQPETSGIEDLEAIAEDNSVVCSSCGEDVEDALELPGAEHYCQSCVEKAQAERTLYNDPDNDNDYRTSNDYYRNLM